MAKSDYPFKRKCALAVAAILTAVCGILWFNNLVAAFRLHNALLSGVVPTDGGRGFWSALQWSVVDASTVTTFIFFFGFAVTTCAIGRNHRDAVTRYDRFHIALGLIGTLWGIILIGYYPIANVTIPSLMNCLHTAMFSTLAAIIWVMVLEPLILVRLVDFALKENQEQEQDADPALLLREVTTALQTFSEQLQLGSEAAGKFQAQLAAWDDARQKEREENAKVRAEMLRALELLTEITASLETRQRALADENASLRQTLQRTATERDEACAKAEELCRKLTAIRQTLE